MTFALLTAGSAVFGGTVLWAAARNRTAGPRLRALVLGAGALLTGLAGTAGGIAVLVAPDVTVDGVPLPAEIPLVGLFLAALLYLPGVLRPHQRTWPPNWAGCAPRGVRTAAAGFGAGPTSLRRLRLLPVDLLQIDREVFGRSDGVTDELGAIVDVTVTLGRRLGMEVIAQGLREPEDLDIVQAAGCRLGQGDLLGRAMPAEHLEAWMEQRRTGSPRT